MAKRTVQGMILELSNFALDKEVRFFTIDRHGNDIEFVINEADQDEDDNPTYFLVDKEEMQK